MKKWFSRLTSLLFESFVQLTHAYYAFHQDILQTQHRHLTEVLI